MPGSGLGALVDVDKLGQTRRSVSLPPLDDVRVGVEGSSRPHKAATLRGKCIVFDVHHQIHKHLSHKDHQAFEEPWSIVKIFLKMSKAKQQNI